MTIRLNKAHFPLTVLGPGRRIGLWMQGCSLHCPGCVSRDTWEADESQQIPIAWLLDWCRAITNDQLDGITISGGEPFEQPEALTGLLDKLHAWRTELPIPFDILCYSGLSHHRLRKHHAAILGRLDALIPEPFIERQAEGGLWRGSSNQPLIPLSELGRNRYAPYLQGVTLKRKKFQVAVDKTSIWCIGIPDRGDLQGLEKICQQRGLLLEGLSWRT